MKKILARILLLITIPLTAILLLISASLFLLPYYLLTGKDLLKSKIIFNLIGLNIDIYEYSRP